MHSYDGEQCGKTSTDMEYILRVFFSLNEYFHFRIFQLSIGIFPFFSIFLLLFSLLLWLYFIKYITMCNYYSFAESLPHSLVSYAVCCAMLFCCLSFFFISTILIIIIAFIQTKTNYTRSDFH